jgi:hypothetical protein
MSIPEDRGLSLTGRERDRAGGFLRRPGRGPGRIGDPAEEGEGARSGGPGLF